MTTWLLFSALTQVFGFPGKSQPHFLLILFPRGHKITQKETTAQLVHVKLEHWQYCSPSSLHFVPPGKACGHMTMGDAKLHLWFNIKFPRKCRCCAKVSKTAYSSGICAGFLASCLVIMEVDIAMDDLPVASSRSPWNLVFAFSLAGVWIIKFPEIFIKWEIWMIQNSTQMKSGLSDLATRAHIMRWEATGFLSAC